MTTPRGERTPFTRSRMLWLALLALALLAAGGFALRGRDNPKRGGASAGSPPPSPPVAVTTRQVTRGNLDLYLTGIGTVTPLATVTVKSRVDGQLMELPFREGENVTRGQLLARIDPRPFAVLVTQAEGQLARDQALLRNAQIDLQRYRDLWAKNSIPRQQLDTQEALVRQYQAALKSDQGQLDSARLQLTYSRITAPCSGRVGLRLVDAGNMIRAADAAGLVVITQLQPITVLFTIPEDSLPRVMGRLGRGERLRVDAYDRERKLKLASGRLLTMDNQIDPATGTVRLRALFDNRNNGLFPNQFVNASLLVETLRDQLLVPDAAIQRGPKGAFLYLVRPDKRVELRPVQLGPAQGGLTCITNGVTAGERVVVDGAERLREGSRVEVKTAAPAEKAGQPQGTP